MGAPDPEELVERDQGAWPTTAPSIRSPRSRDHHVYLYSGNDDQTVTRPVVAVGQALLRRFSACALGNVTLVEGDGGHAFITEEGGLPAVSRTSLTSATATTIRRSAILGWIYGPLTPASAAPQGNFVVFDQDPFCDPGDGFADEGVVYVPLACQTEPGCRVHIALHGCHQSRETVGDAFVKDAGFAEMADTNRLVILFPQAKAITGINPEGCWDWWGYTGLDYLGKEAPQIKAHLEHGRATGESGRATDMTDAPTLLIFEAPLGSDLYTPSACACARRSCGEPLGLDRHRGGVGRRRHAPAFLRGVARRGGRHGLVAAARRDDAPAQADGRGGGAAAGADRDAAAWPMRRTGRAGGGFRLMVLHARIGAEGFYLKLRLSSKKGDRSTRTPSRT